MEKNVERDISSMLYRYIKLRKIGAVSYDTGRQRMEKRGKGK